MGRHTSYVTTQGIEKKDVIYGTGVAPTDGELMKYPLKPALCLQRAWTGWSEWLNTSVLAGAGVLEVSTAPSLSSGKLQQRGFFVPGAWIVDKERRVEKGLSSGSGILKRSSARANQDL